MQIDFHDAVVLGLWINPEPLQLKIQIRLSTGKLVEVCWQGDPCWYLTSFEMQNVLYGIDTFTAQTLPEDIRDTAPEDFVERVLSGSVGYYIDPSVGLGGWVSSKEVSIKEIGEAK